MDHIDHIDGHARAPESLPARAERALNRVAKWRSILAGRITGTTPATDIPTQAYRDLFEKNLLLRVEVSALQGLLLAKGTFTLDEMQEALIEEADLLNESYSRQWPGITATDDGIKMDLPLAADTMRRKSLP